VTALERPAALPTGTVVFMRTDIEGSMDLVRALGARYDALNDAHRAIVRGAVARHGGHVVRTEGDAFFVVFTSIGAAASAAASIQRELAAHAWPDGHAVSVRIGLHAGTAYSAGDDYGGIEVSRAARIASMGWGGQIILSDPARALLQRELPEGWMLRDLGPHRLKGLAGSERLFQLDVPGLRTTFEPLRSGVDAADRPPDRVTTFIGRERDLGTLDRLLAETRLLTLSGPGGSGKTTLAVELARRHAAEYDDGARFVDLQAVTEPAAVRGEIARGVGLLDGPAGAAADRLDANVAGRELLIVIDNFEQVMEAADAVAGLLTASPRSRAILTSRTALKLRAEQEYAVRPMRIEPDDGDDDPEAVRLFVDRARKVRPDIDLGPDDVGTIRETCRLVDGLPLAIELCAARAGSMPLGLIRDRLAAHQPLPGSGPRDLPDRQRTIEAAVAWSHDLLEPPLQRLFARLGVFDESFDLQQAELVAGPAVVPGSDVPDVLDVLDGLVRLTEHNLLGRVDDAVGGVRYGWLETIRSHAGQRLSESGERAVVEARHTDAFASLAAEAATHLPGGTQAWWLDRLAADDANLRAATRRAIADGDVEHALTLVGSLWRYWLQTGRLAVGRDLIARALALLGADAPTTLRVRALDAAGGIAYWSGDMPRANAIYEEQLTLAREIGDRPGEAMALLDLFFTREFAGDIDAALEVRSESAAIMRELGDDFGLARVTLSTFLIMFAVRREDPSTTTHEAFAQAERFMTLDDPWLARWRPALRSLSFHGAVQAAKEELGIVSPSSYVEMAGVDPIPMITAELGAEACAAAVERGRRPSLEEALDVIEEVSVSLGPPA
jgi:predicted ATPase/class 3 adenylate cyclase